jgi:hypothetical protein
MRPGVSSLNLATSVAAVLFAWKLRAGGQPGPGRQGPRPVPQDPRPVSKEARPVSKDPRR